MHPDGRIEREDALTMDALLEAETDAWYGRLLREAPLWMVEVTEAAGMVTVSKEDVWLKVKLPERCRRVVSVKATSWSRPTVPIGPEDVTTLDINTYAGRGTVEPMAVIEGDELRLYKAGTSSLESLLLVMQGDDYRFDPEALNLFKF